MGSPILILPDINRVDLPSNQVARNTTLNGATDEDPSLILTLLAREPDLDSLILVAGGTIRCNEVVFSIESGSNRPRGDTKEDVLLHARSNNIIIEEVGHLNLAGRTSLPDSGYSVHMG